MHLPAIREKISQLPRLHKYLFLVFLILIFIVIAEASYYLLIAKKKAYESYESMLTEITYQEGPFLYSKTKNIGGEVKEPIAIRGRVKKIDGLLLTIEDNGKEALVEMAGERIDLRELIG